MPNKNTKTDKTENVLASAIALAEKSAIENFFKAHGAAVKSVPIKSVAKFGKSYNADCGAKAYEPSARSCAAVAVALCAQNVPIKNGAKASRKFKLAGLPVAIENGCTSDVNGSLITYNAKTETFTLRNGAPEIIAQKLGAKAVAAIVAAIAKADLAAIVSKATAQS